MTIASPFPEVQIPTTAVYEYIFGDLASDADRIAITEVATGAEYTYRELTSRIEAFAGALAARGLGVGDVVGLLAPNSAAFAIAFHGILRSGATATTINALFTAKDIAKQLTDSGAAMLITVTALAPQALQAAAEVGLAAADVALLRGGLGDLSGAAGRQEHRGQHQVDARDERGERGAEVLDGLGGDGHARTSP